MANRIQALVTPKVLAWARGSAGLTPDQAAKKIQVQPERLLAWEQGDSRPTVKQLRKLANAYKRPLAVFYLPEPPQDFQALRDFRRLIGEDAGVESPALRLATRQAQARREAALDLYEGASGGPPPEFELRLDVAMDPDDAAAAVRGYVDVSRAAQRAWAPGYEALNHWRSAFEVRGILVFHSADVDVSEARGFSIAAEQLPVISLNVRDAPAGRIFTLFHELTHLGLRTAGICNFRDDEAVRPAERRVEVFCNQVAGAALLPLGWLLSEPEVASAPAGSEWSDEDLSRLAGRYGVSREVVARRLLIAGRTSQEFYEETRRRLALEYQEQAENRTPSTGGPPPHRRALSRVGPMFAELVLAGYREDRVTASDVADFLQIRLKHLELFESEARELKRRMGSR